jgi:hypothetical protein
MSSMWNGKVFNSRGVPWTIQISLGWTIVLALFSCGVVCEPLGLYLAYWVKTRQGSSAAFWCYVIDIAGWVLDLLLPKTLAIYFWPLAVLSTILALAAPLLLRSEIISLDQRSWNIRLPIKMWLTVLFSGLYLNYSIPDLPIEAAAAVAV